MNKAYRCVELVKIFSATFFSCENTSRCESYGVWKSQQIGKIDEEKRKKGGGYIACPQGTTWHGQVNIGSMWHHHRVPCGQDWWQGNDNVDQSRSATWHPYWKSIALFIITIWQSCYPELHGIKIHQLSSLKKMDCYKPPNRGSLFLSHWARQKWIFGYGKRRKTTEIVKEKCTISFSWVRKWRAWMANGVGMPFLRTYLPNNQKHDFPKLMASPIRIFYFHTLPFPRINYLNQFLKKINDWVQKDKKGSLQLYGFSHWHLDLPYWLNSLNIFSPYSLWNHAAISLLHSHS